MEIDYQLSSFNIRKLVNNGHATRVLYESENDTFICEILGPTYQQSPECQFFVKIQENELLKRDIINILKHLVFMETYQKQYFNIVFISDKEIPYQKAINTLFYSIILHGIRIKDSFISCCAFLNKEKQLIVDKPFKDYLVKMILVYQINKQKILCQDIEGQFNNDDIGQLMSGCISGCVQIYNFLKEL